MTDSSTPRLLAIEASADACSVALASDGVFIERNELTPRQHSQRLLPMVDEILRQSLVTLRDIDAIAFSAGPGSFTGLRLALGVAQGLAFGIGIPLIGVSSLAALAQAVIDTRGLANGQRVLCAVDARMGEYYVGHYVARHGLAIADAGDVLLAPADVTLPPDAQCDCILAGNLSAQPPFAGHAWYAVDTTAALARHLLPLAQVKWRAHQYTTAELAQPVYLRGKSGWKPMQP